MCVCVSLCVCVCVCCNFTETDKQLVELIHVRALAVLSVHPHSSLRYQSVSLFLRGKLTSVICKYNYNFNIQALRGNRPQKPFNQKA